MNEMARRIQNMYIKKIKRKRQLREMRKEMKKLPFEVRRTYIKM